MERDDSGCFSLFCLAANSRAETETPRKGFERPRPARAGRHCEPCVDGAAQDEAAREEEGAKLGRVETCAIRRNMVTTMLSSWILFWKVLEWTRV